jgi:hypothetical protein
MTTIQREAMKDRTDFTVLTAMLKAGLKHKRKLKPVAYAKRLATELTAQRRRYCNAFGLWRSCRRRSCQRLHACDGDPTKCLARGIAGIPREQQMQTRDAILAATPHNISAPEREARQCTPTDCFG